MIVVGRRGGKDEFAAEWLMARGVAEQSPQGAIGPTGEVADILFGMCWQRALATGQIVRGESRWSTQEGFLALKGGGTISRRSCDSRSGNVGVHYRAVAWDEVCRTKHGLRLWAQDFRPTLSDLRGEALWITTPAGYDFVHDLHARIVAGQEPDWGFISAPSWENEYAFPGGRGDPEIATIEREYESAGVPELFRQEYGAEFTILSGVVFRKWDPREMVVPHARALAGVNQFWLGYDWGWDHPTVYALIGRTSAGQWRVIDEDYDRGEAPEQILARASKILERNGIRREQLERLYYDPSRPEQGAMFRRAEFPATAATYTLAERIMAVGSAIGRPGGFLVSDRCKRIPAELSMYRHPDDHRGGDVKVVKVDDDGVDAVAGVLASAAKQEHHAGLPTATPGGAARFARRR